MQRAGKTPRHAIESGMVWKVVYHHSLNGLLVAAMLRGIVLLHPTVVRLAGRRDMNVLERRS